MKKQFDLKYYLLHPETKVVTRDGRNATILDIYIRNGRASRVRAKYKQGQIQRISVYDISGRLSDVEEYSVDLFFDFPDQVKKKVPLTYEDLLERVIKGKTMWVTFHFKERYLITHFGEQTLTISTIGDIAYQNFLGYNASFIDGTPCWKEVEDE